MYLLFISTAVIGQISKVASHGRDVMKWIPIGGFLHHSVSEYEAESVIGGRPCQL